MSIRGILPLLGSAKALLRIRVCSISQMVDAVPLALSKRISFNGSGAAALRHNRWLAVTLGYVFITLPAWILVEYLVYGLINGSAPDFSQVTNKYVSSLERGLITTFVMAGQFALVPLITLPWLVFEGPGVMGSRQATLYVAELLASVALAVAIGLALSHL